MQSKTYVEDVSPVFKVECLPWNILRCLLMHKTNEALLYVVFLVRSREDRPMVGVVKSSTDRVEVESNVQTVVKETVSQLPATSTYSCLGAAFSKSL